MTTAVSFYKFCLISTKIHSKSDLFRLVWWSHLTALFCSFSSGTNCLMHHCTCAISYVCYDEKQHFYSFRFLDLAKNITVKSCWRTFKTTIRKNCLNIPKINIYYHSQMLPQMSIQTLKSKCHIMSPHGFISGSMWHRTTGILKPQEISFFPSNFVFLPSTPS